METHRIIGQLRRIKAQEEFTRDRIGEPGCNIRRNAADNIAALDAAIARLEGAAIVETWDRNRTPRPVVTSGEA